MRTQTVQQRETVGFDDEKVVGDQRDRLFNPLNWNKERIKRNMKAGQLCGNPHFFSFGSSFDREQLEIALAEVFSIYLMSSRKGGWIIADEDGLGGVMAKNSKLYSRREIALEAVVDRIRIPLVQ